MPRIGKKEYAYTPEGEAAYARDAEREHASQDAIAAERRQSRDTAGDELTVPVVVGDKDNQRIMHIPLLVEGQKNVKALERGQKPPDEQILIAIEAAFEKEAGEAPDSTVEE